MSARWSDVEILRQLVTPDRWRTSQISYAFSSRPSEMYADNGETAGFARLNEQQKLSLIQSISAWEELIAPDFVQVCNDPPKVAQVMRLMGIC